jgi:ABC-type spermidine/putrescine transport system permease subunit I
VPAVSLIDFSLLLHAGCYDGLLQVFETALHTALFTLALGYPAGCMLTMWKRKTSFVSCLMPVFFLSGIMFLYGGRLSPLLPQGFAASLLAAVSVHIPPFAAISVILMPLMMLFACSFTKALDPALARTARCLGASWLHAFLTLTFPRALKGVLAGFVTVFLSAAGLALVSDQAAVSANPFSIPFSAMLLLLTALIIMVCLHILKRTRRISPC